MDDLSQQAVPLILNLLRQWLPAEAAVASVLATSELSIFPEESQLVLSSVAHRQAEFAAGRVAAHRCLEQIDYPCQPLLRDDFGGPVWPVGVTGSITHESGVAISIAARVSTVQKLGIDLLDTRRDFSFRELAPIYLSQQEMEKFGTLAERDLQAFFCMKESLVKIFSNHVKRYMDLKEIVITIENDSFLGQMVGVDMTGKGRWKHVPPFIVAMASFDLESHKLSTGERQGQDNCGNQQRQGADESA